MGESPEAPYVLVQLFYRWSRDLAYSLPSKLMRLAVDDTYSVLKPTRFGLSEPLRTGSVEAFVDVWRRDDLGFLLWESEQGFEWDAAWLAPASVGVECGSISGRVPRGMPYASIHADLFWWRTIARQTGAFFAALMVEDGTDESMSANAGGQWWGLPPIPLVAAWLAEEFSAVDTQTGASDGKGAVTFASNGFEALCRGEEPSRLTMNDVRLPGALTYTQAEGSFDCDDRVRARLLP